jgi:hypothetical protein
MLLVVGKDKIQSISYKSKLTFCQYTQKSTTYNVKVCNIWKIDLLNYSSFIYSYYIFMLAPTIQQNIIKLLLISSHFLYALIRILFFVHSFRTSFLKQVFYFFHISCVVLREK